MESMITEPGPPDVTQPGAAEECSKLSEESKSPSSLTTSLRSFISSIFENFTSLPSQIASSLPRLPRKTPQPPTLHSVSHATSLTFLQTSLFPYITNISVYKQHSSELCGFHAYYNAYRTASILINKAAHKKISHALKIINPFYFWRFYNRTLQCLFRSKTQISPRAKEMLKNQGPLERYQLKYLFRYDPLFKKMLKIAGRNNVGFDFMDVSFAYEHFQFGNRTVAKLEKKIQAFLKMKEESVLILYIGMTAHWVSLVLHKTKAGEKIYPQGYEGYHIGLSANNSVINFYFLNSNNLEYMHLPRNRYHEVIDNLEQERITLRGKKPFTPWAKSVRIQTLTDSVCLFSILHDVVLNRNSIVGEFVKYAVNIFFQSYSSVQRTITQKYPHKFVKFLEEDDTKRKNYMDCENFVIEMWDFIEKMNVEETQEVGFILYSWLTENPPSLMRTGIYEVLEFFSKIKLLEEDYYRFQQWCLLQRNILNKIIVDDQIDIFQKENTTYANFIFLIEDFLVLFS